MARNNINRRDFFCDFIKIGLTSSLYFLSNISYPNKKNTNFYPEEEILGIKEPELCGEYFCLRNEPMEAFAEMAHLAEKEGIKLWCSSAYRSFVLQKNIWNGKYKQLKKNKLSAEEIIKDVTRFTSLPGTSRHHWGTDIDIVDALAYTPSQPLSEEHFNVGGEYQYLKYWLDNNAHKFDFYEVYTNQKERTGFKYEPWHYSYKPLAKKFLPILMEADLAKYSPLKECLGFETMTKSFIDNYKSDFVMGINPVFLV